jgi:hypothetical protein
MKHATEAALKPIQELIGELRRLPGSVERKPGIFYVRGKAFLHFHEDPTGLFADVKIGNDWQRFPVNATRERAALVKLAAKALAKVQS